MARHSNGQENYKPAGWVIAVAIAVIVAVIALLFFLLGGDDNDDVNNAADSETSAQAPAETDEAAEESESVAPSAESATSETSEAAESEDKEAASSEPATPSEKAPAPAAASADTLILLDTSAGLAGQFDQVTGALANTAHALGADGKAVALWNYSSPLNPGVTVGYRDNLGFGNGDEAADTIKAFGTGGEPQSRPAIIAAADTAADRAADINGPVRVLVVTTGTVTNMDDAAFTEAFKQAAGDNVELSVVHVGPGEPDAAIENVATEFTTVDGTDAGAVADALKAAAGA